jgi:hypothetical protein
MKSYQSPVVQILLLSTDILLASDENELAIDRLSGIFDL